MKSTFSSQVRTSRFLHDLLRDVFPGLAAIFGLVLSATAKDSDESPLEINATRIGQPNPLVPANYPVTGLGAHTTVNTWIPFSFDVPELVNSVVCEAWIEATIQGIDANNDKQWDCLPSTDALAVRDAAGNWKTVFSNFTQLYKGGEDPRTPKLIDRTRGQLDLSDPDIVKILTDGGRLDALIQDDSSMVSPAPKLFLIYGPIPDPTVEYRSSTLTCQPQCGFPPLPAQPGGGGIPAVPAAAATVLNCTLDFTLRVRWLVFEGQGFRVSLEDRFVNPGVNFVGLTGSSVRYTVNNTPTTVPGILTATPAQNGFTLEQGANLTKPTGQFAHIDYHFSVQYQLALNAEAVDQPRQEQQVHLLVRGAPSGKLILSRRIASHVFDAAVPRLSVSNYLNASAGISGDRRRILIFVRNDGNIDLNTVTVHAQLPAGATYVDGSANPPPTAVLAGRLRWVAPFGTIPGGGHDVLSYEIQLGPNLQQGANLSFQVFASGQGTNPWDPGDTRVVTAQSNVADLRISTVNTSIEAQLSASPNSACFGTRITYTAKVMNTGQIPLENVQLAVTQQTRPFGGNPGFPAQLGTIPAGETRTVTYAGDIGLKHRGVLTDVVIATGIPRNQGVTVAPAVNSVARAGVSIPIPQVTDVAPKSVKQGAMDVELIIKGLCFAPGAEPEFRDPLGNPIPGLSLIPPEAPNFGWQSHTEVRHRINVAPETPSGAVRVTIVNPNGDAGDGNPPADEFLIEGGLPPNIQVTPTSLSFGEVPVGEQSTRTVTVRNTGQGTLTVSSVSVGGAQGFVIDPVSFTVPAGQEQAVTITFKPETADSVTPSLVISSNDPDQGSVDVSVQAVGTPGQTQAGEVAVSLAGMSLRLGQATTNFEGERLTLRAGLGEDPEQFNGELANSLLPESAEDLLAISTAQDAFFSHFTIVSVVDDSGGEWFAGFVEVDIPFTTDTNGDGFPDFYDPLRVLPTTNTQGVVDGFFGDMGRVEAAWRRSAGSSTGTCTLRIISESEEFPLDATFELPFELISYTGTLRYERLEQSSRGTLALSLDQQAGLGLDSKLTGEVMLQRIGDDALSIADGELTNADAQSRPFLISEAQRSGTSFLAAFEMDQTEDGKDGYFCWALWLKNDADRDQDGIPDLSDPDTTPAGNNIDSWKDQSFGANATNPEIAGDLADPDGDRRPNLLEYGMGTPPLNGAATEQPTVKPIGTDRFEVSFPVNTSASDVGFRIERSTLADAWSTAAQRPKGLDWNAILAGITIQQVNGAVRLSIPSSAAETFFRLRVER